MSKLNFEHLETLRQAMSRVNVDAVIIPGTDPHQSEYPAEYWKFRDWITGFTGSNGTAVITQDQAGLWTDSRYFLQAEQQLEDSGVTLFKENVPGEPTITEWLAQVLPEDAVLALDGRLFSVVDVSQYERFCGENGFMLATDFCPADNIWPDRPARPAGQAYVHSEEFAGEDVESKIGRVLEAVQQAGAESILITALDEIAWTFNLRGTDVPFTPVVIAYAYLSQRERSIFIDEDKVTDEVRRHLKAVNVRVRDYDDVERFLERRSEHEVVLVDPNRVSDTLANAMPSQKVYAHSPIAALKAVKNEVQIEGFRRAMERDGAALVRLFRWLEQAVGREPVNEIDVWEQAKKERAKSDLYREDSFAMIAGYKEHGAVVHYEADEQSASTLQPEGLLLLDSGAQYLDGTTDITRTITLGNVTAQERHDYTLVLKGHLALARAQFPVGTRGVQLDALARMPLWAEGLAYWHGTGHGVGHFLGCHEGPHSIRTDLNANPLQPGMVTSDEPGLYRTGQYGIRIENLLLCVEGDRTEDFGDFLRFETLTLFPYDRRLIDLTMLTAEEIKQINDYHHMVLERLAALLNPEELAWLQTQCEPL
ncbi:MAG: aminopeptidase P family protein [Muribaculaceae bacterium]|nr:aminopeptidase P family protein [Muribaculaceae bacterium]